MYFSVSTIKSSKVREKVLVKKLKTFKAQFKASSIEITFFKNHISLLEHYVKDKMAVKPFKYTFEKLSRLDTVNYPFQSDVS